MVNNIADFSFVNNPAGSGHVNICNPAPQYLLPWKLKRYRWIFYFFLITPVSKKWQMRRKHLEVHCYWCACVVLAQTCLCLGTNWLHLWVNQPLCGECTHLSPDESSSICLETQTKWGAGTAARLHGLCFPAAPHVHGRAGLQHIPTTTSGA